MSIKIVGKRIDIKCSECGRQWGIYVVEGSELPTAWNVCLKCFSKKMAEDIKEEQEKEGILNG